jgi:hypothetical protein
MNREVMEIYSDYLTCSFGQTSATGLSRLLDGKISHDQITRFLDQGQPLSKTLWQLAKPLVRRIERDYGVISIDDSIEEKPHSKENGLISWHHDHTLGRSVKGVNFVTAFYSVNNTEELIRTGVPLGCEVIIKKPTWDNKNKTTRMKSPISKNEIYRDLLQNIKANHIQYKYVVNDIWYTNAKNMVFIEKVLEKKFVMAMKSNAIVIQCDEKDIIVWRGFVRDLHIPEGKTCEVYINGIDFPLYISKHIFINENGTTGSLYLCTNDNELTADEALMVYQERWPIEVFHKSLKQNLSFSKCPASRPSSQVKHILCSLYGYIKLEWLKISHKKNHFALRSQIYLAALRSAYRELQLLQQNTYDP